MGYILRSTLNLTGRRDPAVGGTSMKQCPEDSQSSREEKRLSSQLSSKAIPGHACDFLRCFSAGLDGGMLALPSDTTTPRWGEEALVASQHVPSPTRSEKPSDENRDKPKSW